MNSTPNAMAVALARLSSPTVSAAHRAGIGSTRTGMGANCTKRFVPGSFERGLT
jgi:hypothetical protein